MSHLNRFSKTRDQNEPEIIDRFEADGWYRRENRCPLRPPRRTLGPLASSRDQESRAPLERQAPDAGPAEIQGRLSGQGLYSHGHAVRRSVAAGARMREAA